MGCSCFWYCEQSVRIEDSGYFIFQFFVYFIFLWSLLPYFTFTCIDKYSLISLSHIYLNIALLQWELGFIFVAKGKV